MLRQKEELEEVNIEDISDSVSSVSGESTNDVILAENLY